MWISRVDPETLNSCIAPSHRPPTAAATNTTIIDSDDHDGETIQDKVDALLRHSGGGTWPPTPSPAEEWPQDLQPYHAIALLAPPLFVDSSALHPDRTDDELRLRITDNRSWLARELASKVALNRVLSLLPHLDTGVRGGFLACLAYLAHLWRWGTIPVVKIAQDETDVNGMPEEIKLPMRWLHQVMGIETNGGLLQDALTALRAAFKVFAETVHERKIQKDVWMSHAQGFHGWGVDGFDGVSGDNSLLVRAVDAFLRIEGGEEEHVVVAPKEEETKKTETEVKPEPATTTWLGWISRWWRGDNSALPTPSTPVTPPTAQRTTITGIPYSPVYLPASQLALLSSIRQANLRAHPSIASAPETQEIVKVVRLWRLGHTRKAVYYEDLELKERKPMTASGGVYGGVGSGSAEDGEGEDAQAEMIRRLEARLRARVEATR
ncbi:hypothetical protein QFC19_003684 [Naganishia cerealis]|uniref:Uncharacterized protein n=1 Tax=Naganishia cerealis TaxID=610337 RepID=A0ACC2W0C1_9TREE|nr:hypothetical protein QFC19_003684 [Naganishia cerealis]